MEILEHDLSASNIKSVKLRQTKKGASLEVIELLKECSIANEFLAESKNKLRIDNSILFKVLKSIDNGIPFADNQLKDYINFSKSMKDYYNLVVHLSERYVYLDHSIDLHLFGLGFNKQLEMEFNTLEEIGIELGRILEQSELTNTDQKATIEKANILIQSSL